MLSILTDSIEFSQSQSIDRQFSKHFFTQAWRSCSRFKPSKALELLYNGHYDRNKRIVQAEYPKFMLLLSSLRWNIIISKFSSTQLIMSSIILKYFFVFDKLQFTFFFLSVSALIDLTSDPLGDLSENLGDFPSPLDDFFAFNFNLASS